MTKPCWLRLPWRTRIGIPYAAVEKITISPLLEKLALEDKNRMS